MTRTAREKERERETPDQKAIKKEERGETGGTVQDELRSIIVFRRCNNAISLLSSRFHPFQLHLEITSGRITNEFLFAFFI